MSNIIIEDGIKKKCPNCSSIFAIENEKEILYRNITLAYFNTSKKIAKIKCKQCKCLIEIDLSKQKGRNIIVE